jgi:hypothetical protein
MSTQMTLEMFFSPLLQFVASSPTTPYDNCVTNQSFNEQNCWHSIQRRRENLIKLDLESNYMTKHEGPMQVGVNSAGCSVESSPVDSLLDDQGEWVEYRNLIYSLSRYARRINRRACRKLCSPCSAEKNLFSLRATKLSHSLCETYKFYPCNCKPET